MSKTFLEHMGEIEDPRMPGMVLYPFDEYPTVRKHAWFQKRGATP